MQTTNQSPAVAVAAPMRPPAEVMRMARMGSAHPTRLSFLRILMRRAEREQWRFDRPVWEVDARGVGRAVYRAVSPQRTYSLVAFAHDLAPEQRLDRVIATAWDATFALFDGEPSTGDLDRLQKNVPLQEAGRVSSRELSLSRANRSVRLFSHVVDRLAEGRQPDPQEIDAVGYLMRTTAVYGSGKFGAADREMIADRPEFSAPFQAEMLNLWLTRCFTIDIAEHLAYVRDSGRAVPLAPELRLRLGVGNSTGLGMAPFLVRHPILLNNWITARETALARVRGLADATPNQVAALRTAAADARANAANWHSEHPLQIRKLADLRTDLDRIAGWLTEFPGPDPRPWDALWRRAETTLSLEGQEALVALMLEPHGDLVDDLAETMSAPDERLPPIDGTARVREMRTQLAEHYDWALKLDFSDPHNVARFWYVSEEKLEPRLGLRDTDAGAQLEQPLCIARMAKELDAALACESKDATLASFLLTHPEHRAMARRVQIASRHPYAEIRDNLIADDLLPINMMRCKLAFFGATHFDPRSDKWVRISMFQNQPFPPGLMTPQKPAVSASSAASQGTDTRGRCLSRNETDTLVTKAAKGAGFSWGLAEDAGRCAAWLLRRGMDSASTIAALLASTDAIGHDAMRPERVADGWRPARGAGPMCPIWLGAALVDQGPQRFPIRVSHVAQPLLLLPFLARLARTQGTLRVDTGTLSVVVNPDGFSGEITALAALETADIEIASETAPGAIVATSASANNHNGPARARDTKQGATPEATTGTASATPSNPPLPQISSTTLSILQAFALKTTVPTSEASRLGAGSSRHDND